MKIQEHVALAPLTSLGVGGAAHFFAEVRNEKDIDDAMAIARTQNLPVFALGAGTNILVPDSGVEAVVLKMQMRDILVEEHGGDVVITAGAGALWNDVVDEAGKRGVFGLANLAGIPGTVGGAVVQNIGAYGAELSTVFEYADVVHSATDKRMRVPRADADFAYRSSVFKKHPEMLIVRAVLRLAKAAEPNTSYADLVRARAEGTPLSTPEEIARAVRGIRAKKFPQDPQDGTAGSFFKNPLVSPELAASLSARFPGLPTFPQQNGTVKIPLAWVLDRVLGLKGYALGPARLYEMQPLVIVARSGANAARIDELARFVAERVLEATGIRIEREVETFGARA